jgi:hypothetical protein
MAVHCGPRYRLHDRRNLRDRDQGYYAALGLRLIDTELLLRDARNEADDLLDKYDVDNLADVDEVIEAISKHLAEIAAPRRSTPA